METRSMHHCLRVITLILLVWSIAGSGPWRQEQRLAYGAEGSDKQEETSSSVASQIASAGPESMIDSAARTFRERIASEMERVALDFGLLLDTGDLLCLCRDDLLVASAGAAGFENPTDSAAVARIQLGLIYLSRTVEIRFGDGEHGTRPPGFYAVGLTYGRSGSAHDPGIALLELIGGPAVAVLAIPVEIYPPAATRRLTACLDQSSTGDADRICLGWSGRQFTVELCAIARSPAY